MSLKHLDPPYAQIYPYFTNNLNMVRLSVSQDKGSTEQIKSEC